MKSADELRHQEQLIDSAYLTGALYQVAALVVLAMVYAGAPDYYAIGGVAMCLLGIAMFTRGLAIKYDGLSRRFWSVVDSIENPPTKQWRNELDLRGEL